MVSPHFDAEEMLSGLDELSAPVSDNGRERTEEPAVPAPASEYFIPAYWAARLAVQLGDRCVIAVQDGKDGEVVSTFYAVGDDGRLDPGIPVTNARVDAAKGYFAECFDISDDKSRTYALSHARRMGTAAAVPDIAANITEARRMFPDAFALTEFISADEVDLDLSAVCFINGVVDLRTGAMLEPAEARKRRMSYQVPDAYDPLARDPLVDKLFPPWSKGEKDPDTRAWQVSLGVSFSRLPSREFFGAIGARGAGKTSRMEVLERSAGYLVQKLPGVAWEEAGHSSGSQSHNSDFEVIAPPCRLAYTEEVVRRLNASLLKELSGGASKYRLRHVRERRVMMPVSAHIFFVGNSSDRKGETVSFGLAGDSEDAKSMLERAYLLPVQTVPVKEREPLVLRIGDPRYFDVETARRQRQAVMARIVEYCGETLKELSPLAGLSSLEKWTAEQVRREQPPWQTEWMERAFVPVEDGLLSTGVVYDSYLEWHHGFGEGREVSQRAVTNAVIQFLGLSDVELKEGKETPRGGGKRRDVRFLPGVGLSVKDPHFPSSGGSHVTRAGYPETTNSKRQTDTFSEHECENPGVSADFEENPGVCAVCGADPAGRDFSADGVPCGVCGALRPVSGAGDPVCADCRQFSPAKGHMLCIRCIKKEGGFD